MDEREFNGTDKKDKKSHTCRLIRMNAMKLTSCSVMADYYFCFIILFCFVRVSESFEYKLCATAEHEPLCKYIEASTNEITCIRVSDSVDCLLKMQKKEADFGTFYAEEAFAAARFLGDSGLVLAEVRHPDRADKRFGYETVAVVRRTMFGGLSGLKGANYCHPGFSKAQLWSDRVLKEFENKVLNHFKDDVKCNSAMRSAYEDELYRLSQVFNKACRPGTWAVSDWWDKKLKRDYHSLCDHCEHPTTCSYKAQNKGSHSDALRCLTLHGGNITYTALEFVQEYFDLDSEKALLGPDYKHPSRYSFLCPDGLTLPLTTPEPCSWIKQPWTSIIALNTTSVQILASLKEWLGKDNSLTWTNHLRNILTKGNGVLVRRNETITVANYIKEGRTIPGDESESCRDPVKWCTIGKTEKKKCEYISTAALTHGLPIRIRCVEGYSKFDCLKKVASGEADIAYVDTELGYISRKVYNLTAVAYLETQRTGNYYGVLVVKGDTVRRFKDLQGKSACFPQYNGLGWLSYIEALKSHSIISSRSCSNSKTAWNYLSEMCAPGARDPNLNPSSRSVPAKMCQGCKASSCEATDSNPWYGEIGALSCLNNGFGDVAFLDFHAVQKYFASSNSAMRSEDFKILCRDGSLESFNSTNPDKCSFIQVNGGEVVTRADVDQVRKTDISHTLVELDDLFGMTSRSYNPVLRMFETFDGDANVLFKGSAVSLVSVYETQNSFVNNYIKLLNNLENCLNDNGTSALIPSAFAILFTIFFVFHNY